MKQVERVALAGLLHDVGKLRQRHVGRKEDHQEAGSNLLKGAFGGREREDEVLGLAVLAARRHHVNSLQNAHPGDLKVPPDWGLELAVVALADTLASAERENELDREEPKRDYREHWTLHNPWHRILRTFERRAEDLGVDEKLEFWGWEERPEFVPDELPLLHFNVDPSEFEPPEVVRGGGDRSDYRKRYRELEERLVELLKELGVRDHPYPFDPARVAMEAVTSLVPAQHFVPEGRDHMRAITLYDHSLLTASLAACTLHLVEEGYLDGPDDEPSDAYEDLKEGMKKHPPFLLVRGSLSGIGEFIRSVRRASPLEGAPSTSYLKIIRGRSAFVDLLTAGAAWTVLRETLGKEAHPALLLRATGGSFTLLLPNTDEIREALEAVRDGLKRSVVEGSDGVLSLGMAWVELERKDLVGRGGFRERMQELGRKEAEDRRRVVTIRGRGRDRVESPCLVCGAPVPEGEGCEYCERLGDLGGSLVRRDEEDRPMFAGFLVYRSEGARTRDEAVVYEGEGYRYCVHHVTRDGIKGALGLGDALLLVDPAHVKEALKETSQEESPARVVMSYFPWYAATKDDVPESEGEEGIATFTGMAERSPGASLLGFAYVDVDNLGEWVREAAGDAFGTLLSVSRLTDLVFRHWVNALGFRTAAEVLEDVPELRVELADGELELDPTELLPRFGEDGELEPRHDGERGRPFLIVYSGGDDLLVAGAWNEAYSLPFEVFLLFSHVTGYLPAASLSGAVVPTRKKAPFHLVLETLKEREGEAKRAGEEEGREEGGPVRVRLVPKGRIHLPRLPVPDAGPVRFDLVFAAVDVLRDVVDAFDRKSRAYRLLRVLEHWWRRGDVGAASMVAYTVSRIEHESEVEVSRRLLSVLPVSPYEEERCPLGLIDVALIPHLMARRGE
ncbi:type III-A CRISPR-associated protein Cas10/Csm1 [Methanopyrus sp.]